MRIRWKSLRNKIIAWSFVPTAIILIAVALTSLYAYQQVTENLVIERDRDLTRLSASLLATELAAYSNPLTDQYLAAFDAIVVFNANGTILLAEPERPKGWGTDWLQRIPFRQVLRSSDPVYTDVVSPGPRGGEVVVAVIPLRGDDGESDWGIAGLFSLDPASDSALFHSAEKLQRGESNCLYLVDGNGRVIYHSNADYIGDDFSSQEVVQRVLEGEVGGLRTRDLEGREIVASFAPVPDTSWGLVTEESWAALTGYSRRYGRFLLLLLTLGLVLPTLLVTIGVRRITQPISDLIGAAQKVAGGNFSQRLKPSTGDELEDLAEQFNLMAVRLQESYASLEQKVANRTKELASLNAIAAVVSRSLNLEEVLCNALDETLAVLGMSRGQAFRLEAESQTLMLMAHRGLSDEILTYTRRQPLESGAAGQAARVGRPVVEQVSDYPKGRLKELVQAEGIQLVISIPLLAKGKTVGAIDLGSTDLRSPGSEELALLAAIGQQVGVAVENAQLYEQAQQLAVMKERNRLARELHDSVTQSLYGVTLYAEAATRQLGLGESTMAVNHLHEIRETAQEALREMRLLIFELRLPTLKTEGLSATLQARLEAVEGRVGLETDFKAVGDGKLPPNVEEGLYRVAQEALNNALRHAQASRVAVFLSQEQSLVVLQVVDDGIGFDLAAAKERGGFGLCGMEERVARMGGELKFQSNPGEGTRVRVEVCL